MRLFDWTIERNTEDSPPVWHLMVAMIFATSVGYSLGYLLIDVLIWITLTPEQFQGGNIHFSRMFLGFLVMALPMMGWLAWESRDDL